MYQVKVNGEKQSRIPLVKIIQGIPIFQYKNNEILIN